MKTIQNIDICVNSHLFAYSKSDLNNLVLKHLKNTI